MEKTPAFIKHNIFKHHLLISLMVDETETPEEPEKKPEEGEEAVEKKAEELEGEQ